MKLEPPDTHHLSSAQGWLELGNPAEAGAELQRISAACQAHPEVLEARWQVYAKTQRWQKCIEVANFLLAAAPNRESGWIHRSFSLHEMKRTREAYEALLPALAKFPENWLVQYNLACYSCRLQEFERAQKFFEQACLLGDAREVRAMALHDADLRELWERV